MRKFKIICLAASGNNGKMFQAGQVVSEEAFREDQITSHLRLKKIEEVKERGRPKKEKKEVEEVKEKGE